MKVAPKNKLFYHRSWQRLTVAGFLVFTLLFATIPTNASAAAVPAALSYQGRLANSSGSLLGGSGTTYYFKFSIWDAATNGSKLWPSSNPSAVGLTVREGVFNVNIGDTASGYPDALDYTFDRADIYLKVEVSSDNVTYETLSPRQKISASAFALTAGAVVSASSTITNLTSQNATTTNATSTSLHVSGTASTTNLFANILNAGSAALTALQVSGSSTLQNFTAQNSTSTNATTSNFYVSGSASTTNLFANVLRAGAGTFTSLLSSSLTVSSLAGSGTRCLQADNGGLISLAAGACGTGGGGSGGGSWSTTTSQVAGQYMNYSNNNTDIVAIGNFSTTSAPIYFDPNLSFAKVFNQSFSLSSTTLQNFTAVNGTTTSLAAQVLAATGLSNALVKANAAGQLIAASAGSDYLAAMTFAYPFLSLGTGEQSTSTTLNFGNGFVSSASSTLTSFTFSTATGTSATTTNFATTNLCVNGDCRSAFPAALTFAFPFKTLSTGENSTSSTFVLSGGFVASASSTLSDTLIARSTTTAATTTDLYVSALASTTSLRANTGLIGFLASVFHSVTNLLATGSSTLQNFTAQNSTTTSATTTTLFVSTLASTTDLRSNAAQVGAITAGSMAVSGSSTLQNFTAQNSTSSNATTSSLYVSGGASTSEVRANTGLIGYINSALGIFSNILALGSSTLQNFTYQNATGSAATTTNLAVSSISSALLKTGSLGSLISAVSGTDYQAPIAASYPVVFGSNNISLAFGTTTNNSWSGAQAFLSASTTLQNFTAQNSTSTSATTTNLAISSLSSKALYAFPDGSIGALTIGGGLSLSNGTLSNSAQNTFSWPFTKLSTNEQSTSTTLVFGNGFVSSASSTLADAIIARATTTQATTTNLYTDFLTVGNSTAVFGSGLETNAVASKITSTSGLIFGSTSTPQILAIDTLNKRVQSGTGAGSNAPVVFVFDTKNTGGDPTGVNGAMYYNSNTSQFRCYQDGSWQNCGNQATSTAATTTALYVSALASTTELNSNVATVGLLHAGPTDSTTVLVYGSTTLQNFTFQNATGTSATTTNFATANLCVNGDCRSAWPASGSSFAFPFKTLGTGENSTNTTLAFHNGFLSTASSTFTAGPLILASTTLQDFTGRNATTSAATTTSFAATTICIGGVCRNDWPTTTGGGFAFPYAPLSTGENSTSTTLAFLNGFLATASSTLSSFSFTYATGTAATTTGFAVTGLSNALVKANGQGSLVAAVAGTDYLASMSFAWPFTKLSTNEQSTSTTLVFGNGFVSSASSTLSAFIAGNSTTTNATSTNLATTNFCLNGDCRSAWPTSGTFAFPFRTLGTGENSTNTTLAFVSGFVSNASSTLASTTVTSLLANNATATELHVSNLASTSNLRANTGIIGFLASVFNSATNLLVNGSSTLQNFTYQNATGTSATTTNFATTNFCLNGDCRSSFPAASTFAWPFTKQADSAQSTSTLIEFSGGLGASASSTIGGGTSGAGLTISGGATTTGDHLALGSTTLQKFTAQEGTTTSFKATTLIASGVTNSLLKANAVGQIISASAGADYLASMTFAFPFKTLGSGENSTNTTLALHNGFLSTASSTFTTGPLILASTTLQDFTAKNSTTTNATTTNLAITSLSAKIPYAFPDGSIGSLTVGGGLTLSSGTLSNSAQSTFTFPFTKLGTNEQSTSTTLVFGNGFISSASSTLASTTVTTILATNATATNLAVTNIAAGSLVKTLPGGSGALGAAMAGTDYLASMTFAFPFTKQADNYQATSTGMLFSGGFVSSASSTIGAGAAGTGLTINGGATTTGQLLVLGSTTVQALGANSATATRLYATNFLALGSTTLQNATGSDLFISNLASTTNLRANVANIGLLNVTSCTGCSSFAFPFKTLGSGENSTNTTLALHNGFLSTASSTFTTGPLILASTTLQNFTFQNATGTSATTTNLAITSLSAKIPYAFPDGSIGSLTVGGGLTLSSGTLSNSAQSTFTFPFTTLGTGQNSTSTTLVFGNGFVSSASSTLASTTVSTLLSTNATATNLAVTSIAAGSLVKTLPGGSGALGAAMAGTDYLASMTFAWPFTKLGTNEQATTTILSFQGGLLSLASSTIGGGAQGTGLTILGGATTTGQLLALGSTTLQNFTAASSTISGALLSLKATTTDLFVSNLASTTNLRANTADLGNILTNLITPVSLVDDLTIQTINNFAGGKSGALTIKSGNGQTGGRSGDLNITTGVASLSAGNITIDTGGGILAGAIYIGNSNAASTTIGSSAATTTLAGNVLVFGSSTTIPYLSSINATSTNSTSTNKYVSGDFIFDGEIMPDGAKCVAGQILKKTADNNWDCAADDSVAGGGPNSKWATTTISNSNGIYPNMGSWIDVLIGATATTSKAKLEVAASNAANGAILALGSTTLQNTYVSSLTVGSCAGCGNSHWATTSAANSNGIYPAGGAWVDVLIGATATTSKARLEVVSAAGNGGAIWALGSSTIGQITTTADANTNGRVGIGSTSPMAVFSIHASTTQTMASRQFIFAIGSTSPGKTPTTLFGVDGNGRVYASSTRPALSSCGTSPTIVGTDTMGRITVGSGNGASCLVTFTRSWGNAPFCVVTVASGVASANSRPYLQLIATTSATTMNVMALSTTGALTVGLAPRLYNTQFHYYCQGNLE